MNKINSLFKNIDENLFKYVEQLKSQQFYLNFSEKLSGLDEDQRGIVNSISSSLFISLPIIIFLVFLFKNIQTKNDLTIKNKIWGLSESIIKSNKEISNASKDFLSSANIESQSSLSSRISSVLSSSGINTEYVKVENFNSDEPYTGIKRISALVSFKNLSIIEFSNFIQRLRERDKFKLSSIDINKEVKNQTLNGEFEILLFNRSN